MGLPSSQACSPNHLGTLTSKKSIKSHTSPVAAKELFQGYSMCDASSHGAGASFNHQLHPLNGPLWLRISKSGLQGESPRIL